MSELLFAAVAAAAARFALFWYLLRCVGLCCSILLILLSVCTALCCCCFGCCYNSGWYRLQPLLFWSTVAVAAWCCCTAAVVPRLVELMSVAVSSLSLASFICKRGKHFGAQLYYHASCRMRGTTLRDTAHSNFLIPVNVSASPEFSCWCRRSNSSNSSNSSKGRNSMHSLCRCARGPVDKAEIHWKSCDETAF